jgi:hypothetical protein
MTEVRIEKAPKRAAKSAPAKPKAQPHPCECGCGNQTVTGKARFIPGHDAKLASQLVKVALDSDRAQARQAEARLAKLGWTSKLDASRRSRAAKAEAKAKREAKATKPAKAPEQAA